MIREEHRNYPAVNLIEGETLLTADDRNFVDGLHPNDYGMEIYAGNLAAAIRKFL
jgi:lysophospholipase L1-like esterase